MELTVVPTSTGFVCTDGTQYSTVALALAAGKKLFPGYEDRGLYPNSLILTSVKADGSGPGDKFTFATNCATAPTYGTVVENSGQQFVCPGLSNVNAPVLLQNITIVSKVTAGDIISITAMYG